MVPATLLQRRPDIAASERKMAAANEEIGIAEAAFYPTLSLGASAGFEGTSALNWFDWPSRFWAVGPEMAETIFDAGRRRATKQMTEAVQQHAATASAQKTLSLLVSLRHAIKAESILTCRSSPGRLRH